jgi:transposase
MLRCTVIGASPAGEIPEATARLAWQVHPKGTDEMLVRDALGPLFADGDFVGGRFAGMYADTGRPGIGPAQLAMVTVLQARHNLSDRDAVEAMADRICWKYALGLDLDDRGFDASVLSEFRDRLAEDDLADALFELVLDRLRTAGLVKAGSRARTDSTHVLGAVRVLGRIELVGESLRLALDALAKADPAFTVALIGDGWGERYGRRVELARLLGRKSGKTSMDKLAAQIGADGAKVLAALDADRERAWLGLLPALRLLREVWGQQYREHAGTFRLAGPDQLAAAAERIHSPHDPEVRYSTKGRGHAEDLQWVGSKVHLTESCEPGLPHLVIDVHTTAATEPDVSATTVIQAKLARRGLAPGEHLLDAGYPSAGNLTAAAQAGIAMIVPITAQTGRNATLGLYRPADFAIDWERQAATCPARARSRSMHPDPRGLVTFAFSRRDCVDCPLRAKCTTAKPPAVRRITVHPQPLHDAVAHARATQASETWQRLYDQRAGIEATISQRHAPASYARRATAA